MRKSLFALLLITGCASGITKTQKNDMMSYKAKGFYIEEKSVGTAAGLGILPGGGSFYTRNYGFGVVNLLVWPISVLWDPISGTNGAEYLNYYATLANVNNLKRKEVRDLDEELALGKITQQQYALKKIDVDKKYEP